MDQLEDSPLIKDRKISTNYILNHYEVFSILNCLSLKMIYDNW